MQIGVGDKLGVSVRDEHILVFDDKEVLIGRF